MPSLDLNPEYTALISIDLQTSNLARQLAPHCAADVLGKTVQLANALRAKGGTVVWVRVGRNGVAEPSRRRAADAPAGFAAAARECIGVVTGSGCSKR
jgi:nicotinamidase-related amidase